MRTERRIREATPEWFVEYRDELRDFMRREAARYDGIVTEELRLTDSQTPPAAGATVTDHWQPQLLQPFILEGLLLVTPVAAGPTNATGVTLTIGERAIPVIQNPFSLPPAAGIKVNKQDRALVATYAAATWPSGAYLILWGRAAPASMAPGVLH